MRLTTNLFHGVVGATLYPIAFSNRTGLPFRECSYRTVVNIWTIAIFLIPIMEYLPKIDVSGSFILFRFIKLLNYFNNNVPMRCLVFILDPLAAKWTASSRKWVINWLARMGRAGPLLTILKLNLFLLAEVLSFEIFSLRKSGQKGFTWFMRSRLLILLFGSHVKRRWS